MWRACRTSRCFAFARCASVDEKLLRRPKAADMTFCIRSVASFEAWRTAFGEVACFLARVGGTEPRRDLRRVVRGRSGQQELQTICVVMRVEQLDERGRDIVHVHVSLDAEDGQDIESAPRFVCRERHPKAHAHGFGLREVDHPLHPRVNRQLIVAGVECRTHGIWSRHHRVRNGVADGVEHRLAVRIPHHMPPLGQHACARCARPGASFGGEGRKANGRGQRLVVGDRRLRPELWIERLQRSRDPCRPSRVESLDELTPRNLLRLFVIAGAPRLLPECFPQSSSASVNSGSCVSTWTLSG